jgi:hypothetical protein
MAVEDDGESPTSSSGSSHACAKSSGVACQTRATPEDILQFVRNHVTAVLACDFVVVVTATFRVFYVFAVLEAGSRRIRH